jgi:hypothetical protein
MQKFLSRICLDFLQVYSYFSTNNISLTRKVTNTFYAEVLYVKLNYNLVIIFIKLRVLKSQMPQEIFINFCET